jgi:tRNA(fMet)-specific endonuclease VapC
MAVRYLLDSDICIYVMKRRPARLLQKLDALAPACALPIVAHGELCFGVTKSQRRAEASANLDALLQVVRVLPLPVEAAERYGEIRAHLEESGKLIGANDLWIAAHALCSDLTLVTNNEREFGRVPGLRVENWAH